MSDLAQFEHILQEAQEALRSIKFKKSDRESELNATTRATLDTEFGEQLTVAATAVATARKALDDARVEDALAHAKYPIGTVLFQWECPSRSWQSQCPAMKLT